MGPLERVCVMLTKLRDNSCKNYRILLPLLHPCALQFSCALHLFAFVFCSHTHPFLFLTTLVRTTETLLPLLHPRALQGQWALYWDVSLLQEAGSQDFCCHLHSLAFVFCSHTHPFLFLSTTTPHHTTPHHTTPHSSTTPHHTTPHHTTPHHTVRGYGVAFCGAMYGCSLMYLSLDPVLNTVDPAFVILQ